MRDTTDYDVLDHVHPIPPAELFRQWLLTRDQGRIPQGWQSRSKDGWCLAAHPDAQVCDLLSGEGRCIGWMLEPLAHLHDDGHSLPGSALRLWTTETPSTTEVERALYGRDGAGTSDGSGVEGMWIAIVFGADKDAGFRRVYLGAIHSVMYHPDSRTVATTHNLIPDVVRDRPLSEAFGMPRRQSFFPFGLTAFRGIRRLLPNHYLDLDSFEPVRHWPKNRPAPLEEGETGAESIVRHSRRIIEALVEEHRSYKVFLSAGRDSRAVLALLRPFVADGRIYVLLSTSMGHGFGARIDLQAARRLAAISGLPHDISKSRLTSTDQSDVMKAFVRIGEAMAGPSLAKPGAAKNSSRDDRTFKLAGMAGETGRAYYWANDSDRGAVTPEVLARKVGAPPIPQVLEAGDRWLRALPPGIREDRGDALDLAYVEQRLGCWEAPARYLFPGRPRVLSPMAAAYNIERMLRLPQPYRRDGALQRDMVRFSWPELLAVPFNKPTGLLRLRVEISHLRLHLGQLRRRLVPTQAQRS